MPQRKVSTITITTDDQPAGKGVTRMRKKRIILTLLIMAVVIISTTVIQAQSTGRNPWPRSASVNDLAPAVPDQATAGAPGAGMQVEPQGAKKAAIVGSWLGTSSEGNKVIISFTSDRLAIGSVQGGVSTIPEFGVLTSAHGVWEHLGGQQFGYTAVSVNYDLNTGAYMGLLKARTVLTLNATGDQMSGTDKVEIFGPNGELVFAVSGNTTFMRIRYEPFN